MELKHHTPNLPSSKDLVDQGMIRRPIRPTGSNFKKSLADPTNLSLALLGSVSAMAFFPQSWMAVVPLATGYYSWVSSRRFHLPFRVPKNWGGMDFNNQKPNGSYAKANAALYVGQDLDSKEELWFDHGDACRHGFFLGTTGSGKALPVDAFVLTPRGWVRNGDLAPGDLVIHPSGEAVRVLSIHPQGELPVVRIWFSDGRHADCCKDHLWHVKVRAKNDLAPSEEFGAEGKIMTAADLGVLHGARGDDLAISIPLAAPYSGPAIGEGSGVLGAQDACLAAREGFGALSYMPSVQGSPEQRIAFLKAWSEARGCRPEIEEHGIRLCDLPHGDARALAHVFWSLGGVATTFLREGSDKRTTELDLCGTFPGIEAVWPAAAGCTMPGNGDGLEIVEVEPLGLSVEMSCIKTEREDGLYVMERHIVTHNTELLLGICSQTLMWSSGFMFIDGKGTMEFYARVWALAKRFGREDDVRVLNFTDSGDDPDAPAGGPNVQSNTLNPFAKGGPDQLMNLIVGLMGDAGQGNDMWKGRAMSLVTAAMKALCIMRDSGDLLLDVQAIRDFLKLGVGVNKNLLKGSPHKGVDDITEEQWAEMRTRGGMIELYLRALHGDFSNASKLALTAFFDSMPGFNLEKALKGDAQSDKASEQFGFLAMQLTKPLSSLADDYGHIFRTPLGEVDIDDVAINRRILVVLLPALQKAPEEMQNCGKIVVNLVKIMMGNSSGTEIDGSKQKIIDAKQTRAPSPFIVVLDEAGYYMVKGIDVMMAQARSLNFMVIVAGQDMSAMQSLSPQIAETAMANASIFAAGKTVDAEKTLSAIQKVFGRTQVAVTSGYRSETGLMGQKWVDRMEASFQEVEKVTVDELQKMAQGVFYFKFDGRLVRSATFFVGTLGDDGFAESSAINKFVKIRGPMDSVPGLDQAIDEAFVAGYVSASRSLLAMRGKAPDEKAEEASPDALGGVAKLASSFLWFCGPKAGHPANIHGAWLGAMMELHSIEEDLDGQEELEDTFGEDDGNEDFASLVRGTDFDDDEFNMGDFEDAMTPVPRRLRGGAGAEELGEPEVVGASLVKIARGASAGDRHGGLIDLLVAQDSAKRKARRNEEINRLAMTSDMEEADAVDLHRQSIGEFFNILADNSARFARMFAEEDVDGDLGLEILRRSGRDRPLPLGTMRDIKIMDSHMSDIEQMIAENR